MIATDRRTPLVEDPAKLIAVAVESDRLHRHGRSDLFGRLLDQLHDERSTGAHPHDTEVLDTEMFHHGELVGGVRLPTDR